MGKLNLGKFGDDGNAAGDPSLMNDAAAAGVSIASSIIPASSDPDPSGPAPQTFTV